MSDKEVRKDLRDVELPQAIIDSLARFLVPEIRKYYESEQGQIEFERWQKGQKHEQEEKESEN